ncbi:MAG: transglycosylase SLT domain-containing protein, partial [Bryobacteraceae bacterium]
QRSLAAAYPAAPASVRIARASWLTGAGGTTPAITELQEIAASSEGGDRDLARVRLGAARYAARRDAAAHDYLRKLSVAPGEVDAERWYYIAATARRLGRADAMREALDALDAHYPTSRWRLEALLSAASQALVENQPREYEPLYRACFENFASEPRAALCHWKVAWIAYRESRGDRTPMLREHVRRYPESEYVATALYFLGRIAATGGDPAAAKAYFEKVVSRYPNYYYALLAREQLSERAIARAQPSDAANVLALPSPRLPGSFQPDAATERRLERARLLRLAGLNEWAESELRFGARTDAQPHVAGLEMARAAAGRGEHRRGLHLLRQTGLEYLEWPFEAAPLEFWRTAFPLPYRDLVEKYSQDNEIDAFLVAGLIRQESAFDPRAVSRARAMGLTQVRPLTGRDLSRRLGLRGFTASMLFRPEVNLRLGTFHLRNAIEEFEGRMELVLASYNAGRSRALAWKDWGTFQEPAEFIETIPFTETRGYVQAVLRNAAMYRRLYGGSASANGGGR